MQCATGSGVAEAFSEGNIEVIWDPASDQRPASATITAHLQAGRYEEAIPLLETILRLEPNTINSFTNLGMVYSDLGRLKEARQLLERAVELDPADANARVALGVAALLATCQATSTPAQRQPRHATASPQCQPWAPAPAAPADRPTSGPTQPAASGFLCGSSLALLPREQPHRRCLQWAAQKPRPAQRQPGHRTPSAASQPSSLPGYAPGSHRHRSLAGATQSPRPRAPGRFCAGLPHRLPRVARHALCRPPDPSGAASDLDRGVPRHGRARISLPSTTAGAFHGPGPQGLPRCGSPKSHRINSHGVCL
jgi:hypothetical protein